MKKFDKIEFLNTINNIEVKKTINKFLDGLVSMEKNNRNVYVSNFFNSLEINYAVKILKKLQLNFDIIFSFEDYDRKLVIVFYENYNLKDYIEILKFKDIDNIEHRNILGSILSLGISREKIGDIIKIDTFWYVYCLKPIGKFIFSNGLKFSKFDIKLELLDEVLIFKDFKKFTDFKIIVSSLRLDCFVKEISKTSREISKKFIKSEFVKLNNDFCKDFDKKVSQNDLISIRKVGKFKVDVICGLTKKNKYIVNVKRYEQ